MLGYNDSVSEQGLKGYQGTSGDSGCVNREFHFDTATLILRAERDLGGDFDRIPICPDRSASCCGVNHLTLDRIGCAGNQILIGYCIDDPDYS